MVTSESTRTSHISKFVLANLSCLATRVPKPPCGQTTQRGRISPRPSRAKATPIQTGNDVTSHRNVTAIVDLKPELNPVANIRRPRFSFSLFNCQKTDGQNRRNLNPESHQRHRLKPTIRSKLSQETSERVRRSPAAPPPSLVSGL